MSHEKRDARTDLTGRRALLTGGRRRSACTSRCGCCATAHTTITTRFRDAVRRFSALPDSADWIHRLKIVGIDLRDPAQVIDHPADAVAADGPLDILINNAAQTVRRSAGAYKPLVDAELAPCPKARCPSCSRSGTRTTRTRWPSRSRCRVVRSWRPPHATLETLTAERRWRRGRRRPSARRRHRDRRGRARARREPHQQLDAARRPGRALEMLEVQLANMTAPFLLVSRLRPAMAASPARRKYIVNVSAMEGVFGRGYRAGASAHQHGQGRAQHARPHERARDVRDRRHSTPPSTPADRRAPALHQGASRRRGHAQQWC